MNPNNLRHLLAVIFGFCGPSAYSASPCDGLHQGLTIQEERAYVSASAKQLGVASVDLLDAFQFRGWVMLYENTHVSDEVFLFYNKDPRHNHFITSWSGAARLGAEAELEGWINKNAPGIPVGLARCFSWYATYGRDR
jgi:hypothetical protein